MLCGIRSDGSKVFARQSTKLEAPFYCPACNHELNIRKGNIMVHHFAHKPPYNENCRHGQGESEIHRKCKETVYNGLLQYEHVTQIEMEKKFDFVISDIFCFINKVPVAIEIQRSNLSVNEITARTVAYEKLGINVLWLALYNDKLSTDKYNPNAWEKWCHAVYFGRVHYWLSDLTIVPVHYSKYQTYVEAKSWFDQYGDEQSGGDYYKTHKNSKTPKLGTQLNLATDFQPALKQPWKGGSIVTPKCRIYGSNLKKWW